MGGASASASGSRAPARDNGCALARTALGVFAEQQRGLEYDERLEAHGLRSLLRLILHLVVSRSRVEELLHVVRAPVPDIIFVRCPQK